MRQPGIFTTMRDDILVRTLVLTVPVDLTVDIGVDVKRRLAPGLSRRREIKNEGRPTTAEAD